MRETRTIAGGKLPVLALDVVNYRRMRPGQQGRHDQPDAFAAARGRERHDMLRAIMAQIILAHLAKEDTGTSDQAGALQVARAGPARGAVDRKSTRLNSS